MSNKVKAQLDNLQKMFNLSSYERFANWSQKPLWFDYSPDTREFFSCLVGVSATVCSLAYYGNKVKKKYKDDVKELYKNKKLYIFPEEQNEDFFKKIDEVGVQNAVLTPEYLEMDRKDDIRRLTILGGSIGAGITITAYCLYKSLKNSEFIDKDFYNVYNPTTIEK